MYLDKCVGGIGKIVEAVEQGVSGVSACADVGKASALSINSTGCLAPPLQPAPKKQLRRAGVSKSKPNSSISFSYQSATIWMVFAV